MWEPKYLVALMGDDSNKKLYAFSICNTDGAANEYIKHGLEESLRGYMKQRNLGIGKDVDPFKLKNWSTAHTSIGARFKAWMMGKHFASEEYGQMAKREFTYRGYVIVSR